jgi:hypothetical protein
MIALQRPVVPPEGMTTAFGREYCTTAAFGNRAKIFGFYARGSEHHKFRDRVLLRIAA